MKKSLTQIIILIIGLIILIPLVNYFDTKLSNFKKSKENTIPTAITSIEAIKPVVISVRNISYTVDDEVFLLENGKAEKEVASSTSINSLEIFGEPVYADYNGDGVDDAALWLVNNSGGTGVFYYVVLAINTNGKYKSTNTLYLGDRIAPQTLEVQDGQAVFNFADRNADEAMTTEPSIGKSFYVNYDSITGQISEWVKYKDDVLIDKIN